MRWGMVIDLSRCIGCYGCAVACKAENGTPPGVYFRRVLTHEEGQYPTVRRMMMPVSCNHCADAPCVPVCPTGASHQTAEGLVLVDDDQCIGCRYCMMACPYKNRSFLKQRRAYFPESGLTAPEAAGGEAGIDWEDKVNTVVKCTFCVHRLEQAKETGLTPGVDREVTPACVITCPAKAMTFGDLDDPHSELSRLIVTHGGFPLRPEAGTRPSIYYLPAKKEARMTHDWASDPTRWQTAAASGGEDEGEWTDTFIRQSEWGVGRRGWISNSVYLLLALFFGGIGAGAALLALGLGRAHSGGYFVAGYVLAVGGKGFFHLLFLGNPWRFWRAVCRPQTSWISRGIIALSLFSVVGLGYMLGPLWGLLPALAGAEPALAGLCAVLLTFLLVYDGFLLNNATAIGAWHTGLMVILFPVFSALGGAGVLGALYGPLHGRVPLDIHALHQVEAVLLTVGAFVLASYLTYLYADPFLRTSAWEAIVGRLRWVFWLVVVGGGIVAPLVVAGLSVRRPVAIGVMATVALVAVVGDYAFKYVIFSIGGYRQQHASPTLGTVRARHSHA